MTGIKPGERPAFSLGSTVFRTRMKFYQKEIDLPAYSRGFHIITSIVERSLPEMREIRKGQLHVFIKHTSASLTVNENADPTVRRDFESSFNKLVPENEPHYMHDTEGSD